MIKIALSHFIIEACLDNFFHAIRMNFPLATIKMDNIVLGSYIDVSLVIHTKQFVLRGCKVIEKQDQRIWLEYSGFAHPIILIADDGKLIDIRGDSSVIMEHFMETYL